MRRFEYLALAGESCKAMISVLVLFLSLHVHLSQDYEGVTHEAKAAVSCDVRCSLFISRIASIKIYRSWPTGGSYLHYSPCWSDSGSLGRLELVNR